MVAPVAKVTFKMQTFVVEDKDTGFWRLYFGESLDDYDFFFVIGAADPEKDARVKKVAEDAKARIKKYMDRCFAEVEFEF